MHDLMSPESFYQQLDYGIRFAVRVLHANGFETAQSCQGGKDHAYNVPTVDLPAGGDSTGFGALETLRIYDLPVDSVSIVWNIQNGFPYERLWRITFSHTMELRADEQPNFVWEYRAT